MVNKILEKLTGKDDLERIAYKENAALLNDCLKKRRVFVPQRPKRFLDAANFTEEQLKEQIMADARQLSDNNHFEPWILDVDGIKHLPVFSSQIKMHAFSSKMSQELNKVFSLGCIEILLENVIKHVDVDVVDLNLFSQKSWEITIQKKMQPSV